MKRRPTGKRTEAYVRKCADSDSLRRVHLFRVPDPVVVLSRKGGKVQGYVEAREDVDFHGLVRGSGRFLALEAKETAGHRFEWKRLLKPAQRRCLEAVAQEGGVALLFVRHIGGSDYLIPAYAERGLELPGKASCTWSEVGHWVIPTSRTWVTALTEGLRWEDV